MSPRPSWSPTRRSLLQTVLATGSAPALLLHHHTARAEVAAATTAEPLFALGVASGSPRHDRLVLWTRLLREETPLPPAVPVQWELAEDEGFTRVVARGEEVAEADWAHSVHAEPQGLKPDRWYWYRFTAAGQRSAVGRTRTAPAPDAAPGGPLRFVIASCQRWDHGRWAAWREVAAQDNDLVLFLGDYIYESATPAKSDAPRRHMGGVCRTLADYRQRYTQYKSDPQLQAAHAAAPWVCTWDDHEVENDYAGNQSEHLEPHFERRRAAAAQAYWEHLPFPKSARPRQADMRIHTHYDWGTLARLITLDDRQWRDPQVCPKPGQGGSNTVKLKDCAELLDPRRTLLGEAQERWLAESWDASRPWNLLAQQTLMARMNWQPPADGPGQYWTDGWDGYPLARQRLLRDLQARRVANTVVLGGDVHANYVADLKLDDDDAKAAVLATEFCGTSISSHGMAQERIDKALPFNPHIHLARADQRGYQRFVLGARQLQAELRTVDRPWDADSTLSTQARFVVEAGRPGAQRA